MKLSIFAVIALFCSLSGPAFSQSRSQTFFEIKVYHYESREQENTIDGYLKNAFLPALHRKGIKNIGVFKPVGNDTLADKRVYVLIPFKSPNEFSELPGLLSKDSKLDADGKAYLEATYDKAPYKRMESIFIKGFADMPFLQLPSLKNELSKRVYELRSYEGPTEKMYERKVEMFNKGGEIGLFKKLDFNAVFYGSVIAGSRMPNLMYMTTFEDMPSRDAHWKSFFASPEWKELSAIEYYKRTVSKSEIILLTPANYSEI
ncbi:MAG: NIPSNAP family protein [Bacteroidota bacterium]